MEGFDWWSGCESRVEAARREVRPRLMNTDDISASLWEILTDYF